MRTISTSPALSRVGLGTKNEMKKAPQVKASKKEGVKMFGKAWMPKEVKDDEQVKTVSMGGSAKSKGGHVKGAGGIKSKLVTKKSGAKSKLVHKGAKAKGKGAEAKGKGAEANKY